MRRSKSSGKPQCGRPKAHINSALDKNLAAYVTAAAAAGAAVLAASAPAAAEVVYTPVNVNIVQNGPYGIDLAHDGTIDFTLEICHNVCGSEHEEGLMLVLGKGNQVLSNGKALAHGAPIGPGDKFTSNTSYGGVILAVAGQYSKSWFFGEWAPGINKYLGLKFLINGEVHYGWARVNVVATERGMYAAVSEYAYETIPNKSIRTGQTGGSAENKHQRRAGSRSLKSPAPAGSLGNLAAGASGSPARQQPEAGRE